MNVLEGIDALKSGLMWIGLSVLALITGGCVGVWLYSSARSVAAWAWRSRPWFERLALVCLSLVCILRGREKLRIGGTGTTGILPVGSGATGTTGILPVDTVANGHAVSTGGTPVVPVVVTPEEIAQGWRLESVTTNDAVSYAMPANGFE